ncbi:MAG: IS630 family transposase [Chitinophagaceae bacterium]|nr:IS630 family transposase [Chitinophagaceae bacterium]
MQQKQEKKRGSKETQEAIRIRVVDYLKKKLGTQRQCAEIFGLTERSVNRIWNKYKDEGKRGLIAKKRGVKDGKKINGKQAAEVRNLIKDKMPDQLKLPFGLWTREAVQQLISDRYGIVLSRWQVGRYLKSWGYTPQKPIRKAFEQKPEQVKQWLEKEYPAIKRRALKEKGTIYFGDETGMRSDHQAGRSYAPKGHTPVIKSTGQRFSLNMISAISNKGYLQFMIIERFNGKVFIEFLRRMIRYSRAKIFFVTDGHPAHKTKELKEWLEANKDRIEVFFIPPYSPELNAQEYLNQDVKTNVIGKKRPINKAEMRANVEQFMNGRKNNKKQVQKYFHQKHVRYAA